MRAYRIHVDQEEAVELIIKSILNQIDLLKVIISKPIQTITGLNNNQSNNTINSSMTQQP